VRTDASEQDSSHGENQGFPARATGLNRGSFSFSHGVQRCIGIVSNARPYGVHPRPRILKFPSTLDAELVRAPSNGEHATEVSVMAPKQRLKHPQQRCFHKMCASRHNQKNQSDRMEIHKSEQHSSHLGIERLGSQAMDARAAGGQVPSFLEADLRADQAEWSPSKHLPSSCERILRCGERSESYPLT
jgi:hypothetical protein